MDEIMDVLYIGPLWKGSTALQRMEAMMDLGHRVTPVDTAPLHIMKRYRQFFMRVRHKLLGPSDLCGANRQILEAIAKQSFNVAWIDKGLTIRPSTLATLRRLQPSCRIAGYCPDDMANRNNQSRDFRRGLPLYDIYFTTKSFGPPELRQLGCPRAEFIGNGYDPRTHSPVEVTGEERKALGGPVGFIGQWEEERASSIRHLAEAGVPVRVWGYSWERCKPRPPLLTLENRPLLAGNYAKGICSFDINLCFLRKCNRDLQTQRSVEIPACGAFMLAERTDEHRALFEEGKEAEFFSSDAELIDKARYYIAHPQERQRIAAAGRQRCLRSGYTYQDKLRTMLKIVREL